MRSRPRILLLMLACLLAVSLGFALLAGSAGTGPGTLTDLLTGHGATVNSDIIIRLRLPRALAALGTGACLAVAGVFMQVLLRNPLADPYVLGTSGGAAVAALTTIMLGGGSLLVNASAFGGALASTLLVFTLARAGANGASHLLLTGIVVAAGWSAVVSLMLAITPDASLRSILFWLMGDFSFAGNPWPVLATAFTGTLAGILLARVLDVLATGDLQAALLGLDVKAARTLIYCLSAILTALAVTTAGVVGFVGLVVPHLVRLAGGSDHRFVVPAAALAGGTLLVTADTLARTLLAPRQLPVGAITAVVGVPIFLFLLRYEARRGTV